MSEKRNNEVPPVNIFYKCIDWITAIIGLVCAFTLIICGADFPPEVIVAFSSIFIHKCFQDIFFIWYTKRPNAMCLINATITIGLLSFTYLYFNPKQWRHTTMNTVLACGASTAVHYFVDRHVHRKCEREERLYNSEVFTLNSGSMLAYGFYYGYLKLILPDGRVPGAKGVKEKIEDFIDKEKIEDFIDKEEGNERLRTLFPVKKDFIVKHEGRNEEEGNETLRKSFPVKQLFILIPSSSFSHDVQGFGSGMESVKVSNLLHI